jgi:hypothetical protein
MKIMRKRADLEEEKTGKIWGKARKGKGMT